jgi:hypothetical protein
LFAAFQPNPPVASHPFAIYRQLALNPHAMMVCHGLWNNTARVVQYNRAHLGLDARLSKSHLERQAALNTWRFRVEDAERGELLIDGDLAPSPSQAPHVLMQWAGHLGLQGMWQSMRSPFIHVPVVNTRNPHAPDNCMAHTYTRNDTQIIRRVERADRLTIHAPAYAPLNFRPAFVQHNEGVRFVYLRPESEAAASGITSAAARPLT